MIFNSRHWNLGMLTIIIIIIIIIVVVVVDVVVAVVVVVGGGGGGGCGGGGGSVVVISVFNSWKELSVSGLEDKACPVKVQLINWPCSTRPHWINWAVKLQHKQTIP